VIAAGAKRVCVVSAILNAEDVSKRCQEFKKRLDSVA
jgi:thiamine monophosphate synthase